MKTFAFFSSKTRPRRPFSSILFHRLATTILTMLPSLSVIIQQNVVHPVERITRLEARPTQGTDTMTKVKLSSEIEQRCLTSHGLFDETKNPAAATCGHFPEYGKLNFKNRNPALKSAEIAKNQRVYTPLKIPTPTTKSSSMIPV